MFMPQLTTGTGAGQGRPPVGFRHEERERMTQQGGTGTEDLDALSSRELHDRAVRRAVHHLDVAFLWRLLKELPAGEAAAGHPDHAAADAVKLSSLIGDALDSGDPDVADSLRPLYLDYLRKHGG
jgi:hypothetical protein